MNIEILGVIAVIVIALYVAFDVKTNGAIFSVFWQVYKIRRYGRLYIEMEEAILDELALGPIHHIELLTSNDLFMLRNDEYKEILADLVAKGKVREVRYFENPAILHYALPKANIEQLAYSL